MRTRDIFILDDLVTSLDKNKDNQKKAIEILNSIIVTAQQEINKINIHYNYEKENLQV